ncbi:putative galactarate transporter [Porphyromonas levii]|nr:MFS transporter [Porphyromonas levii]MBR8731859.1 putative galactarate transporter [Porphyromonas levii]MBR8770481.1 putative galactarate transporter [Porphyromonas levii]MBR8785315.1 putative galactarate transporter [Porphyromonas levii]
MADVRHIKESKWYAWLVVVLLSMVALLNYLDRQVLSTMRESIAVDIQALQDMENFGMLMAVFLWIYAFLSPVAGGFADRFSRKWIIVGSLGVWSAITLGMGFCTTFEQMLVLRAIMGVSEALYIPAGLALITEYHTGKTRSLATGIHMIGLYLGQALGGFGATVAHHLSWQETFHWFGVIGVAYAVLLSIVLMDKRTVSGKKATADVVVAKVPVMTGLKRLFGTSAFWVILVMFAAPSLPGWAVRNWLPTLFAENLGVDMMQAGPMSTISIAASSLVGVIIGGVLSDKWVMSNLRGRVYTSAIGLALTIPALVLVGIGSTTLAIVGAALCFGIGYGLFDANNMPILCQFVPDSLRSTAYGFMNFVGVLAGAVVTQVLGAWAQEGHLGIGFAVLAGVVLLALILQIVFLRPKAIDMTNQEFYQK